MALNELLPELMKLNHDETLNAIEILTQKADADQKIILADNVTYSVGSPTIAPETADILYQMLREHKEKNG